MWKTIGSLVGILDGKNQSDKGILSVITEKTGKISFRRALAIVIVIKVIMPDVSQNGLTWYNVTLTIACLLASTIKELFKRGCKECKPK